MGYCIAPVMHDLIRDGTAVLANPSAGALLDKFLAVLSPEILDASSVETRGVGRGRRAGRTPRRRRPAPA